MTYTEKRLLHNIDLFLKSFLKGLGYVDYFFAPWKEHDLGTTVIFEESLEYEECALLEADLFTFSYVSDVKWHKATYMVTHNKTFFDHSHQTFLTVTIDENLFKEMLDATSE